MRDPDDLPALPADPDARKRLGPSSFAIPHGQIPRPAGRPDGGAVDEQGNRYQRRIEDIDPARLSPEAMIEHREELAHRPNAFTVEGYIQGFRDISDAAVTGTGERRRRARLLVGMSLLGLMTLPAAQIIGLVRLF